MKLAIEIWNKHIEVFEQFDLVCHNGHSLEEETKTNALFNAIVTLETMYNWNEFKTETVEEAICYLKDSKYYSDSNKDNKW